MADLQFNQDDIQKKIRESLDGLQSLRYSELEKAKRFQEVNHEALKLEHERLKKKYGSVHPKVLKAQERLSYDQQMFKSLDKMIEQAAIKTEPFNPTTWRVHGRVFDGNENPLKGKTVFLSNENKQGIQQLGYSCTDERGYYAITADESTIDMFRNTKLFLSVSDENRKIVCTVPEHLSPVKGKIDNRDIIIDGKTCGTSPFDGG